jgi:hypothetical protein
VPRYTVAEAIGCALGGLYIGMGFITVLIDYKLDYSAAWYSASVGVTVTGVLVLVESLRSKWKSGGVAGRCARDARK